MKIFKLKVLCCAEHEESQLKDLYFNIEGLTGFYIPDKAEEDEHIEGEFVTLLDHGEFTTVLQEPHLIKYLTENFVDNAITK